MSVQPLKQNPKTSNHKQPKIATNLISSSCLNLDSSPHNPDGLPAQPLLDVPDLPAHLHLQVLVEVPVQGRVGAGGGHAQQVAGHEGHHQGL